MATETITLPSGAQVVLGRLKMGPVADFMERYGGVSNPPPSAFFPVLAETVRSWTCTDEDGKPLDPRDVASYAELEVNDGIALLKHLTERLTQAKAAPEAQKSAQ